MQNYVHTLPTVRLGRVTFSSHAVARALDMGVTAEQITDALLEPTFGYWSRTPRRRDRLLPERPVRATPVHRRHGAVGHEGSMGRERRSSPTPRRPRGTCGVAFVSHYEKNPAKLVDKTIRALGGRRVDSTRHAVSYRLPDGAHFSVPSNIGPGRARIIVGEITTKYGTAQTRPAAPRGRKVKREDAPVVDVRSVRFTRHAKERYVLMAGQGDLTVKEVLEALTTPVHVRWSDHHESWMWAGSRVTIAAIAQDDGSFVATTLLWTTASDWADNPRPK